MKFREWDNVYSMVICATEGPELSKRIDEIGEKFNLIDLQYSMGLEHGITVYSALALVSGKSEEE